MSQNSFVEKKIGEHTYKIGMLHPDIAFEYGNRLLRAIGPAIGTVLESATRDGMDSDIPIGRVLSEATHGLSDDLLNGLRTELRNKTMVKTKDGEARLADVAAALFLGDIGAQYAWFDAAVTVNFKGFFLDYLKTRLSGSGQGILGQMLGSQSISTG